MVNFEKLMCLLTWGLLILPDIVICKYCLFSSMPSASGSLGLTPLGLFLFLLFQVLLGLALSSHIRCWLSNPGYTPAIYPFTSNYTMCATCKQYKPPRSHHCRSCKKCVHKMDHHCIWVNNCVGALNQKYFILFLFYTALSSLLALVILSINLYLLYGMRVTQVNVPGLLLVIFTGVEAVFFLFFTVDFLIEQIESIKDNQTCVESYQFKRGISVNIEENFKCAFGKNSWLWLFPVDSNIPINYEEEIINENLNSQVKEKYN